MYRKLSIAFIVLSFSFVGCEAVVSPEKQIQKDWKTTSLVFKTDIKDFTIQRNSTESSLNIKKDGTYLYPSSTIADSSLTGTWKLGNNDKQLILIDTKKLQTTFEIVSLEKSSLILAWQKIDLTKKTFTAQENEVKNIYEDLLSFAKLYADYEKSKPTWIQLHVNYIPK